MSSEAEYERLYQEFVAKGGGTLTFDSTNQTPAEYWDLVENTELSDAEKAALEEAQRQYNYSTALNDIATQLQEGVEWKNPLDATVLDGLNTYNGWETNTDVVLLDDFATSINDFNASGSVSVSDKNELNAFIDNINKAVGVGIGIFGIVAIGSAAVSMFNSVKTHTDGQIATLPETIDNVSQVANMDAQFSPAQSGPCNLFNNMMGFLSGIYDGALSFVSGFKDKLASLIPQGIKDAISAITGVINDVKDGIISAVGGIVNTIKNKINEVYAAGVEAFQKAFKGISSLISTVANTIDTLAKAVQAEIAALLSGLDSLTAKLQALSFAAMSFDPCKMAVLQRAGPESLTSSFNQLNPATITPPSVVQTVADPRANPTEVASKLAEAESIASTSPGVPQSPMKANATKYNPSSSYLHSESVLSTGIETTTVPVKSSVDNNVAKGATNSSKVKKGSILDREAKQGEGWNRPSEAWVEFEKVYLTSKDGLFNRRSLVKNTYGLMELVADNDIYDKATVQRATQYMNEGIALYKEIDAFMKKSKEDLWYRANWNDAIPSAEEKRWNLYNNSLKGIAQRQLDRAYAYFDEANTWYETLSTNLW